MLVKRNGQSVSLDLTLADNPRAARTASSTAAAAPSGPFQEATWDALGLLLVEEPADALKKAGIPLDGGMRVTAVRPGSPAAAKGVARGDVLVKFHRWFTTNEQDVRYILSRADSLERLGELRFEILRDGKLYFEQLALTPSDDTTRREPRGPTHVLGPRSATPSPSSFPCTPPGRLRPARGPGRFA